MRSTITDENKNLPDEISDAQCEELFELIESDQSMLTPEQTDELFERQWKEFPDAQVDKEVCRKWFRSGQFAQKSAASVEKAFRAMDMTPKKTETKP